MSVLFCATTLRRPTSRPCTPASLSSLANGASSAMTSLNVMRVATVTLAFGADVLRFVSNFGVGLSSARLQSIDPLTYFRLLPSLILPWITCIASSILKFVLRRLPRRRRHCLSQGRRALALGSSEFIEKDSYEFLTGPGKSKLASRTEGRMVMPSGDADTVCEISIRQSSHH